MTSWAIGADTSPPVPPLATKTATAIFVVGGREADEPVVVRGLAHLCRTRLARHPDTVDPRPASAALLHDAHHHLGELRGDVGRRRAPELLGLGAVEDGEVGRPHLIDQIGAMMLPSLATPAASMAACSGVMRTSRWPIDVRPARRRPRCRRRGCRPLGAGCRSPRRPGRRPRRSRGPCPRPARCPAGRTRCCRRRSARRSAADRRRRCSCCRRSSPACGCCWASAGPARIAWPGL